MSNGPPPPTPAELEWRKWLHEQNQRAAERAHDKSRESFNQINKSVVEGGNLALRMALLINGGAAVALLTFIGPLPADQKRAVAASLDWFAWVWLLLLLGWPWPTSPTMPWPGQRALQSGRTNLPTLRRGRLAPDGGG